jgi:hypothetical protein
MSSANGIRLAIKTHTGTFSKVAYWPAPFFVLDTSVCIDEGDEPLLYHAESLEDAQRYASYSGKILTATFEDFASAKQSIKEG